MEMKSKVSGIKVLISSVIFSSPGMRHYLGIMMSPPKETSNWSYANFTARVKEHMVSGPFASLLPKVHKQQSRLLPSCSVIFKIISHYC